MDSVAPQAPSYARPHAPSRSRAPGSTEAPLSAAGNAHAPAVVNHVAASPDGSGQQQDTAEADEVRKMQARDAEVRAHEAAHAAAGGALAGAPSFSFERGPDGRSYAVSGEVSIDVSAVSDDPEATISKMQQVKRAALAPQGPSDADRAVAARADAAMAAAQIELSTGGDEKQSKAQSQAGSTNDPGAGDFARMAFGEYARQSAGAATYQRPPAPAAGSVTSVAS